VIRVDLPEVGEPEDGEPSGPPHGPREHEVADQAPGNPGWMRAFTETTAAQREPFADGVERLSALDPVFWHGGSRERFAQARDSLTGYWRIVLDAHDDVLRRVDGHNTFVHQLQHFWEADRGNPAELHRIAELHRSAAAELAAVLLRRAAELDVLSPDPLPPPEPLGAAPESEPGSDPDPSPGPETGGEPHVASDGSGDDLRANGHGSGPAAPPDGVPHEVPATPAHRYQLTERLGEQLVAGVRQYRILWEAVRR
jgi:hypothetical protein